jgi:tetratricopeptide (TPR) repeat protein
VLVQQGKLEQALKSYSDSLAIRERLAATDPSNTQWQSDLTWSYMNLGDVLVQQGRLEEALKVYGDSLAVAERLAAADPSNAQSQSNLAVAYNRVGDALTAQGKLEEALKPFRDSLAIAERLAAADPSNAQWQQNLQGSIGSIGDLANELVLARDFTRALEACDLVISIAPDQIWLYTNRAHALMFLGRDDEARTLYLQYRDEKDVGIGKSWKTVVLEDFAELRKAGLTHPLMDEIEKRFAAGG